MPIISSQLKRKEGFWEKTSTMYRKSGFSLVEVLVVVLILGAVAAIAVPRIADSANAAKLNTCRTNVDVINTQFEIYHADSGDWPDSLVWLVTQYPDYFPDGIPQCPFNSPYTVDALTYRIQEHSH